MHSLTTIGATYGAVPPGAPTTLVRVVFVSVDAGAASAVAVAVSVNAGIPATPAKMIGAWCVAVIVTAAGSPGTSDGVTMGDASVAQPSSTGRRAPDWTAESAAASATV